MTETERQILEALNALEHAAKSVRTKTGSAGVLAGSTPPKRDLQSLFSRLDDLARQLPPDADRNLRHYLQRKSYDKARLLLLGREAENAPGTCH